VGLLIAVIFLSAWGSIAAALNSLASCTVVDFHKKFINKNCTDAKDYSISRWYTFGWGVFSIIVAMFAYNLGNSLIEAVNILGSLFYGVILGIFLVAFWMKWVGGNAVFIAAVVSEALTILVYNLNIISFLWLNVIGALLVIALSVVLQPILPRNKKVKSLA
jgi:SSS family solute:Na+ symporter